MSQELSIRPEANIEANVPEDLDLFQEIFEVDSESEPRMGDSNGAPVQNNVLKEQVSD